jgi:hypothetical protein
MKGGPRIGRVAVIALAVATFVALALAAWSSLPDREDHRGPRYVLWKHGLLPFDPTVVYPAMVGDVDRDRLVVGLTMDELRSRFGVLRSRAESTVEYQRHYADHFFVDQQVVWLGDSAWLLVMSNGRAASLHLMKG